MANTFRLVSPHSIANCVHYFFQYPSIGYSLLFLSLTLISLIIECIHEKHAARTVTHNSRIVDCLLARDIMMA